jgi:S-(hydroxymethyl)glutathione dehydrogenase/alcohol dehydrogenase
LGHEGAGVVEEVGAAVGHVHPGDRVVLSWNPACGLCFFCARGQPLLCQRCAAAAGAGTLPDGRVPLSGDDGPVLQFMFMGSHAEYVLVTAAAAVPVPAELPFRIGAAIGCGITTGVVPALHSPAARVPGSVIAIVGCGIVGLSVIAGARLAGGATILAIDRSASRLELAGALGADVVIDASREDPVEAARAATSGRGADHVFEAAGNEAAMRSAFALVRPGGELTLLGKLGASDELTLPFATLMGNKTIRRLAYGGARPPRDFPALARLYLDGRLPLDRLIDREIELRRIVAGFEEVERGETVRTVVAFGSR